MNIREVAERLKSDIRLAARLGFANVRPLCAVPIEAIEMALPTAEKYNVRMGKEIHAPMPIKPRKYNEENRGMRRTMDFRMAEQIIELADRTGSKYVGLVPDFGIFQHSPSQVASTMPNATLKSRRLWILSGKTVLPIRKMKCPNLFGKNIRITVWTK